MLFTFRYTFCSRPLSISACIGPIALASAGIVSFVGQIYALPCRDVSAALLVVASITLTWRQAATYNDMERFGAPPSQENPNVGWRTRISVLSFLQQGNSDDAIAHYRLALQMQADSDAEVNLGTALMAKGQVDEAILL